MKRSGHRAAAALCALTFALAGPARAADDAARPEEKPPGLEPIYSGLTEETEVRRLFLDVEAIDEKGLPMPGLTREDFRIRLNHLPRKIDTVDDLCPCDPGAPGRASPAPGATDTTDVEAMRLAQSRTRFVMYFDISQMARSGRQLAAEQARRWVGEVMQPGDEVMLVAYSTEPGLRELCPFTTDAARLLQAIETAEQDPELEDPFPLELGKRLEQCRTGTLSCYNTGRQDYFQMRRSLWAMLGFLTRLNEVGGRKALLLFHQYMTMFPGRVHEGAFSEDVPDLIELTGEVGAAATAARTEVYPVAMGPTSGWAINLGANLGDFTGGLHNGLGDGTDELLAGAGRGCRCIYRIGVEPPSDKTRIYTVKVKADGWVLPNRYRAHYLKHEDRWARRAEAVLTNPHDAWDFAPQVAILPENLEDGKWRLKAQVALDLERIEPSVPDGLYEWEVGVLLTEIGTLHVEEMLAVTQLRADRTNSGGTLVVHERTFDGLDPAEYELRAYIHDRNGETYGGARTKLQLADNRLGGVTGPVPVRRITEHWLARLPLRGKGDVIERIRLEPAAESRIPRRLTPSSPHDALSFLAWFCPGKKSTKARKRDGEGPAVLRRYVVGADGDPTELNFQDVNASGDCVRVEDRVDTSVLVEGDYEYRFESPGESPIETTPFVLGAGALSEAAAGAD